MRSAFTELGRGAIVSDARSILCAWKQAGGDSSGYRDSALDAAERLRDGLHQDITIL